MPYATSQDTATTSKEMVERRAMGVRAAATRRSISGGLASPRSRQPVLTEDCVHALDSAAANAPSTSRPAAHPAQSSEELPHGTVMGIPPLLGRPAFPLQMAAHEIATAVLRGVNASNYPFLRQMLMLGWVSTEDTGVYEFAIVIHRGGTHENVEVRGASMLHYAICCSSFECAAALLIAQPSLVNSRCYIGAAGLEMSTTELASFLCGLYCEHEPEAGEVYRTICAVLCQARSSPASLPFLDMNSAAERLTAAGPDGQAVVAALASAVRGITHFVQPMRHVDVN